ncbi:hypothetical protein EH228_18815 [Erwinia endophytica]|uniref:cell envelope integrity TolA C-terminal domain-containing protein n=1 Tax=Erwinia endophytica TaxID=1563158 RepID=UPI001265E07C|nr:cell envelope integrity TolA C-terminal domain-containing protein [Erwinia endophytica]KAB8306327.1 hypothetical protein EH228_18815 [Erwinia endophytica]
MVSGKNITKSNAASWLVGILLLSGCQSGPKKGATPNKPLPPTPQEMQQMAEAQCRNPHGVSRDDCLYLAKMQFGIQHNFYPAADYKGRECTVTITWKNGRYSVLSATGDEILCLKTWSVISSAENLPPPPKQMPPQLVIDFKPR